MVRKNYAYIDWFRLPTALMVIAIHTAPFSGINPVLDTIVTYGLGRIAVPFFFMTTGYFVIAPYVFGNFPALLMGSAVLVWALKRFPTEKVFLGTTALYLAGLLGDSYYGLTCRVPVLRILYEGMFQISSYTRNGIFYAPLFLLMGMLLAKGAAGRRSSKNSREQKWHGGWEYVMGFLAALLIMLSESCVTAYFDLQRHSSMYLALPAVMYFLYKLLLIPGGKAPEFLRSGTAFLYVIHPIGIIIVRGAAGRWKLEKLLVDNSLIHYAMVCIVSLCMMMVWLYLDERRKHFVRKRQSMD